MRYTLAIVTFCALFSAITWAEEPRVHLGPKAQKAAAIASWITLGITYSLDARASWKAEDRKRAFLYQGLRFGLTQAAVGGLKHYFPRDRPCAPNCGKEVPDASFCSGHTANAFQAAEGGPAKYQWPLAASTGVLRWAGDKHWLTDVGACALLGAGLGHYVR